MIAVDRVRERVTSMAKSEHWKLEPDPLDYGAASRYLSLRLSPARASALAADFESAPIVNHRANDLLRSSGLPLLPETDPEVAKDLKRVKKGEKLAPVLLVRRGQLDTAVIVADGYHRICASYRLDEDAEIPCRIVDDVASDTAQSV
jgi:hypothetical protein